ncbi:MAG: glycosyltransferase [bacterium]
MKKEKTKKFISIIWGYSPHMYSFAPEENYHLHAIKVAKDMGFKTYAIVGGSRLDMENDPHFDKLTEVLEYKNFLNFLYQILKFSFQGGVFYVNSYEWQSFVVPFLARKTIFMAHTQPKRQTRIKQLIQNFVYNFYSAIRLNNETEKEFLLKEGTKGIKLFVVPLVVSQDVFKLEETGVERRDLVCFGNVTEKKNILTVLKAFELIKSKYPLIKINIIGKIFDTRVIDFIEASEFKKDFILQGFLPNKELVMSLNKNLIYINSSFDEGQCVAVYDAALCGCVLCLPNIMSFKDVFKNSSLIHEVNGYKQIALNIEYYIKNPSVVAVYRQKNIDMIEQNYSIQSVEKGLIKLISNV